MKNILLSVLTLVGLSTLLVSGCSSISEAIYSGVIVDRQFTYKNFTQVEISGPLEYEINQAEYYSVVSTTSKHLIYKLDISQSGQTLLVTLKPGNYNDAHFKVTITMPDLTRLEVSAASYGEVTGFDSTGDFKLEVTGAPQLSTQ